MEEAGAGRTHEGGTVRGDGPDPFLEDAKEGLGRLEGRELEVQGHEPVVVDGLEDAVPEHAGLLAYSSKAFERGLPGREVGDRVLDAQRGHASQRVAWALPGTIPLVWDLRGREGDPRTSYAPEVATRPSGAPSARLLTAVGRLCASTVDSRVLRAGVLEMLAREMPVDAYAFVLTDPETSVGVDPLASIPDLVDLPRVVALKYLTSTHRWTTLDDVVSIAARPVAARGPFHDHVLGHGFADVVSMVLRDRFGCWGFLDLWSASSTYAERDLTLLRGLDEQLTAAVRRCQASTFAAPTGPAELRATDVEGPAVILLDTPSGQGLAIAGSTPGTGAWLTRLLPPDPRRAPVPAAVLNVAAQLLAREAGVDDSPATARVHVGTVWLRLRASRLEPSGQIAVTIELAPPADRVAMFARTHGLSPRERALLEVLADGVDTAGAAARLFITPHTVQDHLKSVFAKAGAHSRRELLGRVLGVGSAPG